MMEGGVSRYLQPEGRVYQLLPRIWEDLHLWNLDPMIGCCRAVDFWVGGPLIINRE